jgi:hypothetical protein
LLYLRLRRGFPGMEPECIRVLFNRQDPEPSGLKTHRERIRINWNKRVADVHQPQERALSAVTANENSSRLEHTTNLAE